MITSALRELFRLLRNETGVTLVEYGLAIALAILIGGGALVTLAGEIAPSMNAAGAQMVD